MARWVAVTVAVTVAVKRIWVASNPLGIGARIEIKLGVPGMGFEPIRTFVLRFLRPLSTRSRRYVEVVCDLIGAC